MNILYFASLKESLNTAGESIQAHPDMTVGTLKSLLIKKHGSHHFKRNILCAVNHQIAHELDQLTNEDEVAFYPPVTGG